MSEERNRQWLLAARPVGMVKESDFAYRETAVPEAPEGGFLARNLYLAFDPAMRGWIEDRPSYLPPVGIGEVMRGNTVAQVVASQHPDFSAGEFVRGFLGWQDYAALGSGPSLVSRLPKGASLTNALGVLGTTGVTAYFGMLDVGRPRSGETVVVSTAAGATGSVAAQIAKLEDCRVIGIAGGPEKCAWLTREAGLDAAIDYKSEDVARRLGELCPDGIDVYFDNVGGGILEAVLDRLAPRARVVLCGAISRYNEETPSAGPRNYYNLAIQRGRMEGFNVIDYLPRADEAAARLSAWVAEGKLAFREDVQAGLENAPRTLLRLFSGQNFGRQLLKIADPPI
jgi:NADPH-dependent curcumin reductase CurA